MYNIPTSVKDNSKPKRKNNPIIFLFVVVPISICLMVLGLNYIKIFNTHGHSMQPAIEDDSLVVCIKTKEINPGDIIAFYSRGDIKIKRVIALSGDTINIDKDGKVLINDKILVEHYLNEIEFGEYEIELPHTVKENRVFVLGDNRGNSLDSRHHNVGDIKIDDIICEVKLVL